MQTHRTDEIKERNEARQTLAALFLIGGMLAVFGLSTLYARASLTIEGTITQSSTICDDPSNRSRCHSTYSVMSAVDGQRRELIATGNDASIQQRLPIGTTLSKRRWQLVYDVNGVRIDDFPRYVYFVLSGSDVGLIATGIAAIMHRYAEIWSERGA